MSGGAWAYVIVIGLLFAIGAVMSSGGLRQERESEHRQAEAIAARELIPWRVFSRGVAYGDQIRDPRFGWAVGVERLDPFTGTILESERIQWYATEPHPVEKKAAEIEAQKLAVERNTPRNSSPTDPSLSAVQS